MQTTSNLIRTLLALAALGLPAIALAHHGWSGYDSSTALDMEGTIREVGYEHPHGYVKLEAPGKTWLVVLAPPSRMEARGLAKTTLVRASAVAASRAKTVTLRSAVQQRRVRPCRSGVARSLLEK